jgi:hypothetical protein
MLYVIKTIKVISNTLAKKVAVTALQNAVGGYGWQESFGYNNYDWFCTVLTLEWVVLWELL